MGKMGRFSPDESFVDLGRSSKGLDTSALVDVRLSLIFQPVQADTSRMRAGNGRT